MLVYPADRIVEINESSKLGIRAEIKEIDFRSIMDRMRNKVNEGRKQIELAIAQTKELDYYKSTAHFIGSNTLEVDGTSIRSDKIYLSGGARPLIPSIQGIENISYLTSDTVLELKDLPSSIIIIGGGDVAVEYAHFFSAMGTDVSLIQRNERLIPDEEMEISALLKKKFSKRMNILTGIEAIEAYNGPSGITVQCLTKSSNEKTEISAEKILIAAGRRSNADLLKPEKAGIKTDSRGFLIVDEHFQTTQKNIWAFGDALGKNMYRHVANRQALLVWHNSMHSDKLYLDDLTVPYAIFTYPQIASVGLKERQAASSNRYKKILVGFAQYSDIAMGDAMMEDSGFAKAVVDGSRGRLLGFHIIGPHASILIQEVITVMASGGDINMLGRGMHIHPALPELIVSAFNNLRPAGS